jgi:DNA invertase Pin-like site-specific DNA recombinase/Skp family chaperone for outer membrane proteins
MKTALYARFSTSAQREQSLEDQFRVCEQIAERHGFAITARFSDKAISGGTANRPGYQRMLAAARRGEFDVIVSEDVSRLWRSMAEQAPRLAELHDLGIAVVTHDLDTRQETGSMMGAVLGAGAEQYRKEIGRRTRRGLEGNARNAKRTGGRAFGYRDGKVDPEQAHIVIEIFSRYRDGESALSIAADLNARRIPSPGANWNRDLRRRGGWVMSCIAGDPKRGIGILNNELYRGRIVWNRSRWIRSAADSKQRRQVQNPPLAWIVRQDESLRIIPEALWNAVKARQTQRADEIGTRVREGLKLRTAGRQPGYLFSGLLRCGVCGSNFQISNTRAYGCASRINGKARSNRLYVRRDVVEHVLLAEIKRDLSSPEIVEHVRKELTRRLRTPTPTVDARRVKQLEREIDNLVSAVASGALRTSPALAARLAEAEAELAALKAAPPDKAPVERLLPRLDELFLAKVRELEKAVERDVLRARQALISSIETPIPLHPENGVLVAEIGVKAPLPLVADGVSGILVAGARFLNSERVIEVSPPRRKSA